MTVEDLIATGKVGADIEQLDAMGVEFGFLIPGKLNVPRALCVERMRDEIEAYWDGVSEADATAAEAEHYGFDLDDPRTGAGSDAG